MRKAQMQSIGLRLILALLAVLLLAPAEPARADAPGAALWSQAVARYRAGDHAGAATLALQAARAGNPTATYELGFMYANGDGVPQNPKLSAQWYIKAAQMGHPMAENAVGHLYEDGDQVPDDWIEPAKWYMKSAQQGYAKGEFSLARAFQYGVGVPLDLNQAASWYDKAAAQGNSQAGYYAQYIRNNHGMDGSSYSNDEQAIMAPYMTQPWFLHAPPTGRVFRSTQDRLNYFHAWARNAAAYEACRQRHFGALPGATYTCPAPEPPR
jgi:TPR repeat protein